MLGQPPLLRNLISKNFLAVGIEQGFPGVDPPGGRIAIHSLDALRGNFVGFTPNR